MPKELYLTVRPFPPSVNHYLGYRAICKGKKGIVMPYTTAEAKKFKKEFIKYAKEQVKKQNWDKEQTRDKHYYMDCIFYFPRKDKDEQNYMKVLSDCLNEIAYIDDKNILTRTHKVYYDTNDPRIELTIKPVEYVGIFPNQQQLHKFEDKCKTCKRYKRNCSILRKAKEGRIQKEIDSEFNCEKFNPVDK